MDGFCKLAAAVLLLAVREARRGDIGAALWIHGPKARAWAELLGMGDEWPPKN
jgi:hypothetical protein